MKTIQPKRNHNIMRGHELDAKPRPETAAMGSNRAKAGLMCERR